MLEPKSPLLNIPNRITMEDFDGWVQERGLYFATNWDPQYETPLESHDRETRKNRAPSFIRGTGKARISSRLILGNGNCPQECLGAFRIFANLISAGKVGN
jgi:hypothetical protein